MFNGINQNREETNIQPLLYLVVTILTCFVAITLGVLAFLRMKMVFSSQLPFAIFLGRIHFTEFEMAMRHRAFGHTCSRRLIGLLSIIFFIDCEKEI